MSFACSMSLLGAVEEVNGASPSCLDGTPAGLSGGCGISGVAVGNDHGRSGRRELNVRWGARAAARPRLCDERVTYRTYTVCRAVRLALLA